MRHAATERRKKHQAKTTPQKQKKFHRVSEKSGCAAKSGAKKTPRPRRLAYLPTGSPSRRTSTKIQTGLWWVLVGFGGLWRALAGFGGLWRVLSGFVRFYPVLSGFIGFCRVLCCDFFLRVPHRGLGRAGIETSGAQKRSTRTKRRTVVSSRVT